MYDNEDVNSLDEYQCTVKNSLIEWVVKGNIPRIHVCHLLKKLHFDEGLNFLPLDWRTLMTSRRGKVLVIDMPPGKYQHFSVRASLYSILCSMESRNIAIPDELNILFNIDGLPLSKSSMSEFWPILCKVIGTYNLRFKC